MLSDKEIANRAYELLAKWHKRRYHLAQYGPNGSPVYPIESESAIYYTEVSEAWEFIHYIDTSTEQGVGAGYSAKKTGE